MLFIPRQLLKLNVKLQLLSANSYDDFNELTQTVKDGITSTYTYNGEGFRVAKNVDSSVTRYLYEHSNVILETDNDGDETARNTYGINLLIREVGADSYYYFYNGHADVTALMDKVSGHILDTKAWKSL